MFSVTGVRTSNRRFRWLAGAAGLHAPTYPQHACDSAKTGPISTPHGDSTRGRSRISTASSTLEKFESRDRQRGESPCDVDIGPVFELSQACCGYVGACNPAAPASQRNLRLLVRTPVTLNICWKPSERVCQA